MKVKNCGFSMKQLSELIGKITWDHPATNVGTHSHIPVHIAVAGKAASHTETLQKRNGDCSKNNSDIHTASYLSHIYHLKQH